MGADIHVHLVKFNHESRYFEELKLYRYDEKHDEFKVVRLDIGRDYEMFDEMKDGDFPRVSLILSSLEPSLEDFINERIGSFGFYGFYEISLADFNLYLNEHPKVKDYDAVWEDDIPVYKENPLKNVYEECISYISFVDNFYFDFTSLADYRMIFYFDN